VARAAQVDPVGKPRRVLVIVENLPVPFDSRVWSEATTLAAAGYHVSVICPRGEGYEARYELIDGIAIYRHPLPRDARGRFAYLIEYGAATTCQFLLTCWIFLRRGFDVIHACNPPDTIFLVAAFFRLFGRRLVFDHHDPSPELYAVKFSRRDVFYRLLLRLQRRSFRSADVVITTNESQRRLAIERAGVPAQRLFVVRSGPRLERIHGVAPNPSLRHGRKFLVGYVGLMSRQDGIHLLLEAARRIVHDIGRADVQFCLAGDGPELTSLRNLSAAYRVSDYVTFCGRLEGRDLLELISTADVCVNPDEVNELSNLCTTIKVMEYMALGKPVVQFDSTEGRISAQDASLYARPNDAEDFAAKIVALLDDAELRRVMGERGRERVRSQLAWTHQVPKLLAAYDAVFRA